MTRRNQLRFVISLEITLRSESNFWVASTDNISEEGVYVATKELKPIGSEIEITIRLPNPHGLIWSLGVVQWIRETSNAAEAPLGMGVRFQSISKESQAAIRTFLGARAPLCIA
jgi:uncharacterized protein (TIGR02266 family)